jgi:hypothetical protein
VGGQRKETIMHLTRAYRYKSRRTRAESTTPVTACGGDGDQVSIYHEPEREGEIDCPGCLEWLAAGDNRLLVTKGGINQWLRNHVGDENLYCTTIPIE